MRAALAALGFLTVLPVGRRLDAGAADVARGSVLFPVVGAGVGAISGGLAWWWADALGPWVAAVLGVLAGVAVTGALHLDGLADCCDGLGGRTPEDRRRIMRDHATGVYGASALALDLLLRVAVLAQLAGTREVLLVSVAAGALSRATGPMLSAALPYAQASPGAGAALSGPGARFRAGVAVVLAVVIAVLAVQWDAWAALAAFVVVCAVVGLAARRLLGGVTGDVFGAAGELVEVTVLVALAALS